MYFFCNFCNFFITQSRIFLFFRPHSEKKLRKKKKEKKTSQIMIIPVRCYSCGKTLAHLYEPYRKLLDEDMTEAEALQAVGATRICCRRMLMTHIDLIDNLMPFNGPVIGSMQRLRQQQANQQPSQQQQAAASAAAAVVAGASSSSSAAPGGGTKSSSSNNNNNNNNLKGGQNKNNALEIG
jgi:DNA-directed RNA polymerases I, II, and III subunit RPABC5